MIRIAFTLIGGKKWTGGYNYLLNLVRALEEQSSIKSVLFFGEDVDSEEILPFHTFEKVEIVTNKAFNSSRKLKSLCYSITFGRDPIIQRAFAEHKIDVFFEVGNYFGWNFGTPGIAWIPDFQHRYLPHLFSKSYYWKRELGIAFQKVSDRTFMFSSHDSRNSFIKLYHARHIPSSVVSFAISESRKASESEARKTADKYDLPDEFFFMPNQFWRHKNHKTVVDALALLKEQGNYDITVVCSGQTLDPRNPDYFKSLEKRVEKLKLGDNFRILGLIPYADLTNIMLASKALLNPSLFEGWSTTIEEAKALGIPMILSDLPVHMEQTSSYQSYFERNNPESLATKLTKKYPREPNYLQSATEATQIRAMNFSQSFTRIACAKASKPKHII